VKSGAAAWAVAAAHAGELVSNTAAAATTWQRAARRAEKKLRMA
jgi:hypothetical protein